MPLSKCPRCEKLFNKTDEGVCPACCEEEEKDFETIRNCLDDHPEMNAERIAETTGVDIRCVMRMLDRGLIANVALADAVKCGQCGAPAISHSKRLCQACLEKLNQKMLHARKTVQVTPKKQVQVGEYMSVRKTLDEKRGG
jgi:predicted amidophosphoribosyltransferase